MPEDVRMLADDIENHPFLVTDDALPETVPEAVRCLRNRRKQGKKSIVMVGSRGIPNRYTLTSEWLREPDVCVMTGQAAAALTGVCHAAMAQRRLIADNIATAVIEQEGFVYTPRELFMPTAIGIEAQDPTNPVRIDEVAICAAMLVDSLADGLTMIESTFRCAAKLAALRRQSTL